MTVAESILAIVKDYFASLNARVATVKKVTGNTCTVVTLDTGVEIFDVRLQAEETNGMLLVPKEGSFVIIDAISENDFVVIMYSALDSVKFLDGSYGGLTKTQELKTQLDKTNQVVQALVDSLSNWAPVANDGGAALKTFFSTAIAGKTVGDYSDIENDKITHGTV